MEREHHISLGPLVAAVGGLVLLVSLFLDWYERVTGWTVFELADLLLAGLALGALFGLAGALGAVKVPDGPVVVLGIALLALVVVLTQIVNDPPAVAGSGGPDKDIGIWLALGGAGLMTVGAVLATTHISLAVEAREREPVWDAGPEEEKKGESVSARLRRKRGAAAETGTDASAAADPGGPERP